MVRLLSNYLTHSFISVILIIILAGASPEIILNISLTYFLVLCFLIQGPVQAQNSKCPVAKFTFNNREDEDEIGHKKAKLVGISHAEDRFGNNGNAIYLFGNENSYINLGTSPVLKPRQGSISLWLKIDAVVYSGIGGKVNPIILTKCADRDDFYEAYSLYYFTETEKICGGFSKDSTQQSAVYSSGKFTRLKWHHLVLTYDDHSQAFYMDGKLETKSIKNFIVNFNPKDSVMVGVTANKKNSRSTNAAVDDIEIYDRVLSAEEVEELYHAPNPNKNRIILNWVLLVMALLAGITLIYLFLRYRFNLTLKKEKQKLELVNTLLENELRINRALMNPHFMFNSLNTLHHYILTHNVDKASQYLVKFSKLIRKILDSNMSDTISLEQEIDLIESYLEIEGLRFKEHIRHSILLAPDVVPSAIIIPIMMLQPFVENSVWHGLRDKQGDKFITVTFSLYGDNYLQCLIEDNGTGRKKKSTDKPEKKSLATNFVMQRLALLNKIYNLESSLSITDKENAQGTIVKIILPILNKTNAYAVTSNTG